MPQRLPSLSSLRAFEAAARHMSLSRAADELHVTPAAVSHQVKAVEEDLGIKLFDRENRRLTPTQEARAGLTELRRGFELITEGVRRIRDSQANPMLRVTSEPTFAGSWLVPRLAKFRQDCPDLDVMIDASDRLVNFEREAIDIGIRWGGGIYTGLASEQLFEDEEVFPVCHPKLLTGKHPLRKPKDLKHHTLVHLDWPQGQGEWADWQDWLTKAGVTDIDANRGLHFTVHSNAIRAALDQQGVVLATSSLVSEDLASGALVRPFDVNLPTSTQMFLVYRPDRAEEPAIKAFRDWIRREADLDASTWYQQTRS
jgi:LysR family glycine cleavage system transcriptional activator